MLFHFCGSPSPNFGESANNIHECAIDNANNAKIILVPFMRTLTNQYFFGRNIFFLGYKYSKNACHYGTAHAFFRIYREFLRRAPNYFCLVEP